MEPSMDGIKAIAEMALPRTYTGVHQFLGATGYFRRFIKGYAQHRKPLNDLLSGINSKLKSCFCVVTASSGCSIPRDETQVYDSPSAHFRSLPQALSARDRRLRRGAVLSQKQEDGCYHSVDYASRGLKGGELRYHSSKLEFLALKWVITEQFHKYLQYQLFCVKTDNNPLTYVMSTPNLDAVGHRWVASLAGFNFTIEYLLGADNKVADALS